MSGQDSHPEPAWAGFDWTRERYEDLIARVIPDYDTHGSLMIEAIRGVGAADLPKPFRVLDLGAGTGTLARYLLEALPQVELTALDVSPVMVAELEGVLAPFGPRARVVEADLANADLGTGYRAAVSRLALHHLDDDAKVELFGRVFRALLPGGLFVDCDMMAGETDAEAEAFREEWRVYMIERGDDPEEWVRYMVGENDHPATERAQAGWLVVAGFSGVRTIWRRAGFAMISARRPASRPRLHS